MDKAYRSEDHIMAGRQVYLTKSQHTRIKQLAAFAERHHLNQTTRGLHGVTVSSIGRKLIDVALGIIGDDPTSLFPSKANGDT